ncbi:ribosomal silencing factor RsfS [Terrihabitans soli]|uniref:Ribosomal silencing factor RsfS n=1 Tax=Terrihabitans soli TaxID=708113 RepID=A0A6S6QJL3_9HYPH|nr:ribosome silencing factor [Terrihabitans soli]BCJ89416.1 ribosomal silencing factor RsfS [Terrihabitans soli]
MSLSQGAGKNTLPKGAPAAVPAAADLNSLIQGLLDDAKAEKTTVIDLTGKSSIADVMIVTEGRANRHVAAIADRVVRGLKEQGHKGLRVEGLNTADWVLIDAGDVILHIFRPEVRSFYNLEKMWSADRPVERMAV